ncbi:MAG: hypothetical protein NC299_15570 [Lachnospiraceae bacterium]|nr:hypothetical protein [Ruminococcus sp.]MCM1276753.1 hypothetical protein [Lachnospiraceae bacterium]
MVVAFFGHGNTPSEIYPLIERKIAELAAQNDDLSSMSEHTVRSTEWHNGR